MRATDVAAHDGEEETALAAVKARLASAAADP
jgi:hypothetical protein